MKEAMGVAVLKEGVAVNRLVVGAGNLQAGAAPVVGVGENQKAGGEVPDQQ
jgi:hypothetical protein